MVSPFVSFYRFYYHTVYQVGPVFLLAIITITAVALQPRSGVRNPPGIIELLLSESQLREVTLANSTATGEPFAFVVRTAGPCGVPVTNDDVVATPTLCTATTAAAADCCSSCCCWCCRRSCWWWTWCSAFWYRWCRLDVACLPPPIRTTSWGLLGPPALLATTPEDDGDAVAGEVDIEDRTTCSWLKATLLRVNVDMLDAVLLDELTLTNNAAVADESQDDWWPPDGGVAPSVPATDADVERPATTTIPVAAAAPADDDRELLQLSPVPLSRMPDADVPGIDRVATTDACERQPVLEIMDTPPSFLFTRLLPAASTPASAVSASMGTIIDRSPTATVPALPCPDPAPATELDVPLVRPARAPRGAAAPVSSIAPLREMLFL